MILVLYSFLCVTLQMIIWFVIFPPFSWHHPSNLLLSFIINLLKFPFSRLFINITNFTFYLLRPSNVNSIESFPWHYIEPLLCLHFCRKHVNDVSTPVSYQCVKFTGHQSHIATRNLTLATKYIYWVAKFDNYVFSSEARFCVGSKYDLRERLKGFYHLSYLNGPHSEKENRNLWIWSK